MIGGVAENVIYGAQKFLTSVVISRTLHNFEPIKKALSLPDSFTEHEDDITDKGLENRGNLESLKQLH